MLNATILTTKPAHQAQPLLDALSHPGFIATNLASTTILPPDDLNNIAQICKQLITFNWAIFSSANALAAVYPFWPNSSLPQHIAAIGPATAAALVRCGMTIDAIADPPGSSGLLQLPVFSPKHMRNSRIVIFCGKNPKPVLAHTLIQRQAEVIEIECYQRACAEPSPSLIESTIAEPISTIVCASRDSLKNLYQIFTPSHLEWLFDKQLVVISPTMKQQAEKLGWQPARIHIAANATNSAIVSALQHLSRN